MCNLSSTIPARISLVQENNCTEGRDRTRRYCGMSYLLSSFIFNQPGEGFWSRALLKRFTHYLGDPGYSDIFKYFQIYDVPVPLLRKTRREEVLW